MKPETKITEIARLGSDEYAALAAQFPPLLVVSNTTDLQAGYLLGVQAVLEKLRQGFVIGGR